MDHPQGLWHRLFVSQAPRSRTNEKRDEARDQRQSDSMLNLHAAVLACGHCWQGHAGQDHDRVSPGP